MSQQERFESKYIPEPNSGCWLWMASCRPNGYGQFVKDGRRRPKRKVDYAHRVSWELFCGEIPKGLQVLHKCDVPCCVNPDHLFLGTQIQNMQDCLSKGRLPRRISKISDDDFREIASSTESLAVLAERYGVTKTHICAIRKGRAKRMKV
jgi:hypothetical protein